MIRKIIIYSFLMFFIHTISYSQKVSDLSGKWVSKNDKLNIIEFKGNKFYQYYDNELEEKDSFFLSNKCNIKGNILEQKKPVFLNQVSSDNSIICSEISTLTKNTLTLMYSENGRISTYIKQKILKRKNEN